MLSPSPPLPVSVLFVFVMHVKGLQSQKGAPAEAPLSHRKLRS